MGYIISVFFLLTGMFIGLNLADIDLQLPFLFHRSILTHGFLIAAILYGIVRSKKSDALRLFALGFYLSSAIHLAFDLFPRSWQGYALITVPVYGRTSAAFSWLWIALSIVVCLYLALVLMENGYEIITAAAALFIAFSYYATTERIYWSALLTLLIASIIAIRLPSDIVVKIERMVSRLEFDKS